MRPGRAGRYDHPVEPVFFDPLFNFRKTRVRTGIHGMRGNNHMGVVGDGLGYFFDINGRCDIDAAMTDKHANPRLFISNIMLSRICLFRDEGIACLRQQFHRHGGRGARLGYGFGYIFGFLERTGDENTGP